MKEKYRDLCKVEPSIPIFSRDWWLDTVCGEKNWNVCCVERDNQIVASMPYFVRNRYGMTLLQQPPLTQTLGPWIRRTNSRSPRSLEREKELMGALIEQLPRFSFFLQNWHYSITNWLPFYWKGFSQTTRYTYVLDEIYNLDAVWSGMQENIRREIRKATNRFELSVREDIPFDEFFDLTKLTFARQGLLPRCSYNLAMRLWNSCSTRKCGRLFVAVDFSGRRHAGAFVVWDEESAYYLLGGGDPSLRNSGASSLCLWEAIKFASTVTKKFDFEGSMVESIERVFRAFGARQTPYFNVSKSDSLIVSLSEFVKSRRTR